MGCCALVIGCETSFFIQRKPVAFLLLVMCYCYLIVCCGLSKALAVLLLFPQIILSLNHVDHSKPFLGNQEVLS